ncbi:MAG: hypothetical protein HXX13_13115 [Bacteroidetes bacterium]|nr:hypothetical protein [Bacteroidota bacterium]
MLQAFSQEVNLGIYTGLGRVDYKSYPTIGGSFEYRIKKSYLSINVNPYFVFSEQKVHTTLPLYLKFIIGKQFRVSPLVGGFIRSGDRHGWEAGLEMEYLTVRKLMVFWRGEYMLDYYKDPWYAHSSQGSYYLDNEHSVWFSLGLKWRLLYKP